MSPELQHRLYERFPNLYRQHHWSIRRSCMPWGFEVGDGWFNLLWNLSYDIERIAKKYPTVCACGHSKKGHLSIDKKLGCCYECNWKWGGCKKFLSLYPEAHPVATQVKEKFGSLRFYIADETTEVEKIIEAYENFSLVTCENCGEPGRHSGGRWLKIRCFNCCEKEDGEDYAKRIFEKPFVMREPEPITPASS